LNWLSPVDNEQSIIIVTRNMRTKLASLTLALITAASAQAQTINFIEGPATVTLALTLKSQIPGTVELDDVTGKPLIDPDTKKPIPAYENSKVTVNSAGDPTREDYLEAGKIASRRYGNTELLRDLLAAGELGDSETSIAGWGIFSTSRGEDGSGETTLVARKTVRVTGQSPITTEVQLGGLLDLTIVPIVSNFSFSETASYTYSKEGDLTAQVMTGRGTYADEGMAYMEFAGLSGEALQSPLPAASAVGSMTETGSEYRWYPDPTDRSFQESILLSSGVRINGIVGSSEGSDQDPSVLMTGTANLGRTSAVPAPSN
jgi:hypothetical protein